MAEPTPDGWPKGVRPIGVDELDNLGLNARNELFWNGEQIEVKQTLVLTWWQKIVAVLAVIASFATIATGTQNAALFLCARNVHWLGCPTPLAAPPVAAPVAVGPPPAH